jgi:hypothetical protein
LKKEVFKRLKKYRIIHGLEKSLGLDDNDLMKYIGANLRTRDVAVCHDEASKHQNKVSQLVLEVTSCFHESF